MGKGFKVKDFLLVSLYPLLLYSWLRLRGWNKGWNKVVLKLLRAYRYIFCVLACLPCLVKVLRKFGPKQIQFPKNDYLLGVC